MGFKCLYEISKGQCAFEIYDVSEELLQSIYNLVLFIQNISGGIYVTMIIFTIAITITYLFHYIKKAILSNTGT